MNLTSHQLSAGHQPSRWISGLLFTLLVGLMAWLRLYVYPHSFLTLTFALPLLVCLLHRDKVLLWAMAVAFTSISTYKVFALLHISLPAEFAQWAMQLGTIAVTAIVIHLVINLSVRLQQQNLQLEQTNAELSAREEEISRQNEELQVQSEELAQQNEELGQQTEELQAQSEELQQLNAELSEGQQILQILLTSVRDSTDEWKVINDICTALRKLVGPDIQAVAVVEKIGDSLVTQAWSGEHAPASTHWPFSKSFASVIMEQGRTGFVDLERRPDFRQASAPWHNIRSILATPLRLKRGIVGAVKVCSTEPRNWTRNHFRIVEWVASQCAMALDIMRLRGELQELNNNLERTVQRRTAELKDMVEELEHFSYTITHDMRAPLRAIHGFAALIEESNGAPLSPEAKDCLDHVSRSIRRMDRLILDALSYSKAVRQELALAPLDPEELLRGIIYSYPVLQPPRARIEVEPGMPRVLANEAGLTQCFSNLLTNAVKFVKPGTVPHVVVRAETSDSVVRIWFEDNGIGISQESHKHLFKMFHRGSKEYDGTGIGLALVRKVATRMNGRVGVDSIPGKGSRFWLELPPDRPETPDAVTPASSQVAAFS